MGSTDVASYKSSSQAVWSINKEQQIVGYLVKSKSDSTHTDRLNEFIEWAKINHPEELVYLMPEGIINPEGDRPQR